VNQNAILETIIMQRLRQKDYCVAKFEGLVGGVPALLALWNVAPMSLPPSPDPKAGLLGLRLKSLSTLGA